MTPGAQLWHKTPVGHVADRCLAVWAPHVACEACAVACPRHAISIRERRVVADDRCVGCGRCAVACPTGAIETVGPPIDMATEGRDEPMTTVGRAEPMSIDCRRVPATAGTVRVACLGGLTPSDLLETLLAAGERPVHLIDRGWCAACPVGGAEHPAGRALAEVARLLSAMGAAERAPTLVFRPLTGRPARSGVGDMEAVAAPARRALLRSLVAAATDEPTDADSEPPRPLSQRLPIDPVARRRTVAALGRLAARLDVPVAPSVYPAIGIDETCCNHRVCVAVCPTAALAVETTAAAVALVFDPVRCIACGACAHHCPERAVSLAPEGLAGRDDGHRRVVRQHALCACADCGQPFAGGGDDSLCVRCRKTRAFAAAAAAFRFGGETPPADHDTRCP